jgi:hypothetical protein
MFRPSINPDINPEELHDQFVNQGSVVIRNFLRFLGTKKYISASKSFVKCFRD